ncbi:uncharacterized protein LOC123322044 [Coccinella septempunctata]|uniref:uncharacterized protein LOC123322044 n=1 Tax=Coccinella septempunctata TaxID=41139 RepID=UPI001D07E0DB|nr:uncharacterized protein LOC123322044 [Coccinella septempunctata]
MEISVLYALWIFFGIYGVIAQGDSLRSALNAVDRRQRYFYDNPIIYPHENSAELSYLPDSESIGGNDLLDYFSEDDNEVGKQISSSFRERQGDREKQLEELSQRVLSNLEGDDSFENSIYRMQDPWRKYRNDYYARNDRIHNRKRQFYPEFGYDSIGLRKRDKYAPSEYTSEYNDPYNMNNEDYPSEYMDTFGYAKRAAALGDYGNRYENIRPNYWSNVRHIPVTKRSSEYPKSTKNKKQQSTGKTDPKVEKDLSSVFAGPDKKKTQKYPKKTDEVKKEQKVPDDKSKTNDSKAKSETQNNTKKTTEEIASEKPIQISKKSIDWSDYFGLDRRKKNKDFDKEWVMDRYHKAIAASKKNAEYPLQMFRDHDGIKTPKRGKNEYDDLKLENMDRKLKSIEDEIVDDALKYTGANEGVTDPKDIAEVEDGIISRLAKAYSIEKMRRALGEYKMLVDKEREKLRRQEEEDVEDETFSEEKRVSVPRKQAVDPNKDDKVEDNHIKCAQGNADCDEENYKTPIEVIQQMNYEMGGCPKIQRDCRQVSALLGQYAKVFEEACNLHQMCLLCGNNNWYPATRQCNILYLSKVYDMCEGKSECQKEMQKSVRYLMNINRNIRDNPSGNCNLVCPDGPDGA